ncbi:MAG: peptide-methionine (R)-S-oxide reductase MsrB [Parvularcula sp.]|nr:peptide-methionine (R)-S-oxide reductase MsrB [Parvularcula sp.]
MTTEPSRRHIVLWTGAALILPVGCVDARDNKEPQPMDLKPVPAGQSDVNWATLSEEEWRERLTDAEFRVLRKEGTERSGTSPLNDEKRKGVFICAGCALPLFQSDTKYNSGTGWPSFFDYIDGALGFKTDYKLIYPRKEYHCSRCGGHQGHVFKDGPEPTGLRYCNNGVALDFVADETT